MIDSKKNKNNNNKKYRGGAKDLYDYTEAEGSNPKYTIITQDLIDLYGYPQKYIGYNVAISPTGIKKPFTIWRWNF